MASEAGTFAFGRGKSILFSSELLRLALFALLALFVLSALPPTHAQISVFHNGTKMEFPLAQLWYDGYWKEVRPSFNLSCFLLSPMATPRSRALRTSSEIGFKSPF